MARYLRSRDCGVIVGSPVARPAEGALTLTGDRWKLKVTLGGVRPAIWRRLEVPAGLSLFALHRVVQTAMGWTDRHLHQFMHLAFMAHLRLSWAFGGYMTRR